MCDDHGCVGDSYGSELTVVNYIGNKKQPDKIYRAKNIDLEKIINLIAFELFYSKTVISNLMVSHYDSFP